MDIQETKPISHYEYRIEIDEKAVKQQALRYLNEITGWCSEQKGAILVDMILKKKPEKIVEIGVWAGKSLLPMAYTLKAMGRGKVYGIDPWSAEASIQHVTNEPNIVWWSHVDHDGILLSLINNIKRWQLEDYVEIIINTSENADPIEDIDLLHIDGNHSDYASYLDVNKWVPLVKSGGWIIFDDMSWNENGIATTARAVKWLDENCIKMAEFQEDCSWGVWIKP